jgi:hypothetical protein
MIQYTEKTDEFGTKSITRIDENGVEAWIPCDLANSDYQAYLDRDKPKAALSTPIVSSDG